MIDLSPFRLAGVVYVLYFLVAIASGALARGDLGTLMRGGSGAPATAVWVGSTAVYAVLVVLLARLLWDVDPRIAVAAIAFGFIGCVVQSAASVFGLGRDGVIAGLFFFGLFMLAYGWLITQSSVIPSAIGVGFMAAGLAACALPIPGLPAAIGLGSIGLAAIAEGALAVWLLVSG